MTSSSIETKVDAMLAVLDDDIRHAEATIAQLDTLRMLLIKRDDTALEQLLRELRAQGQAHGRIEERRQALRQELADELGCDAKSLTLSALQKVLSGPRRVAIAERQQRLKSQIRQLKREHTLTQALVIDCARFNRSLMHVFFGADSERRTTYGATGVARHRTDMALVSLHY